MSNNDVVSLLETAVRISEILYLPSTQRSPKRILQLYNYTWLHHVLCRKLFPFPKVALLFGSYLHHLMHAPMQYENLSLGSVNTEAEERLFGQGKQITSKASDMMTMSYLIS